MYTHKASEVSALSCEQIAQKKEAPSLKIADVLSALSAFIIVMLFVPTSGRDVCEFTGCTLSSKFWLASAQALLVGLFVAMLLRARANLKPLFQIPINPVTVATTSVGAALIVVTLEWVTFPLFGTSVENPIIAQWIAKPSIALPMVLAMIIVAPIMEELLFRGLLFSFLRERLGFTLSAVLSSVVFTSAHFSYYEMPLNIMFANAIFAFIIGVTACTLFEKSKSLLSAILFHSIINLALTILAVTVASV